MLNSLFLQKKDPWVVHHAVKENHQEGVRTMDYAAVENAKG